MTAFDPFQHDMSYVAPEATSVPAHVSVVLNGESPLRFETVNDAHAGTTSTVFGIHSLLQPPAPHPVWDASFGSHCSRASLMPSQHQRGL